MNGMFYYIAYTTGGKYWWLTTSQYSFSAFCPRYSSRIWPIAFYKLGLMNGLFIEGIY